VHVGGGCRDIPAVFHEEGLTKCPVLPPKNPYCRVLPHRCRKRLIFCLFKTCAEQKEEDAESSVNPSPKELWYAVGFQTRYIRTYRGYVVIKIFKFDECEVILYNPKTGKGGYFVQYVNTFLKLNA
jgi:hypothetical protein